MIRINEDALICDLAETYQIYDYKQLPVTMVAVFSCGLRDNSRIQMELSGQTVPLDSLLLAGISDRVSFLLWSKTKDGQKGKNRPKSIVDSFTVQPQKEKNEIVFNSGKDFEEMRQRLVKGADQGGEGSWQQN
ncbi:DUF5361 domain-containing protein [Carnobacterium maltaromaticum]|uniref:DUF5361 domain-containing protein n=1 Tax=Carnobacterium maltaromaticum TaxID=2751 RepID=UPI0039AF7EC8